MSVGEDDVQALLKQLTPDQRAVAETIAQLKIENRVYEQQVSELQTQYDALWKVMIVLLHVQPKKELRIHNTQFLRFKDEYRIDRTQDGDEVVLRLLTLTDTSDEG